MIKQFARKLQAYVHNAIRSSSWPTVCFVACACAWLVFVVALYYPGTPTRDTLGQLQQALDGSIDNWKPALYAYILQGLNALFGKGNLAAAFLMQACMFACGYALIVYSFARRERAYLWAMPFIFLFNEKGIDTNVIGNDALCAACFLVFFGIVLVCRQAAGRKAKRFLYVLAFVFLFVGFVMRHNSFPAVVVMAMFALFPICKGKIKTFCCAVALAAVFAFVNALFVNVVCNIRPTYPLRFAYAVDMVNISILNNKWEPFCIEEQVRVGEALPPPASYCLLRADVCNFYSTGFNPYYRDASSETLKSINDSYFKGWLETVSRHPAQYAFLKGYFFHQFLLAGRSLPLLESFIASSYPHVSTYGGTICHNWRAWCNLRFVLNSLVPLIAYASLFIVVLHLVRKRGRISPDVRDAMFMIGAAGAYVSTFTIFTLSSSEARFYIITSSLCCIAAIILAIKIAIIIIRRFCRAD